MEDFETKKRGGQFICPSKLKYQFSDDNPLKISDKCCYIFKERPLQLYEKETKKKHTIVGIMQDEGGRRHSAQCIAWKKKHLHFQPLAKVTKEWEDWFIDKYNIKLCELYYPPFNFTRTGCKGCPFALKLQDQLDILEEVLPSERKQCEVIWKPVYDEYRRIGYRLKNEEQTELF